MLRPDVIEIYYNLKWSIITGISTRLSRYSSLGERERGTKTRWKDNTEGETTLCVLVINNSSSRTIEAPGDRSCRAVKNVSNECPPLAHLEERCNSLSLIIRLALELETGADVWMTRCWGTPPCRDKLKQTRLQLTDWGNLVMGLGLLSPPTESQCNHLLFQLRQYFTVEAKSGLAPISAYLPHLYQFKMMCITGGSQLYWEENHDLIWSASLSSRSSSTFNWTVLNILTPIHQSYTKAEMYRDE